LDKIKGVDVGELVLVLFQQLSQSFNTQLAGRPKATQRLLELYDLAMILSQGIDLLAGRSLRSAIRVALIAGIIADRLGMPQRPKTALLYAALLHDIGLVSLAGELSARLPEGVTEKQLFASHPLRLPAELSAHSLDLLKSHPLRGGQFIDSFGLSADVKDIIALHHERQDGTGYPHGLAGKEIPMAGCILGFADAIEACMEGTATVDQRKENITTFLNATEALWFEPTVVEVFKSIFMIKGETAPLQQLFTPTVSVLLRQQFVPRSQPLSADAFLSGLANIGRVIDLYMGKFTQGYAEKTATIAQGIATRLEIPSQQQGELITAAYLCNIGMLAVPIDVLLSGNPLTDEQWEVIHDHPRWTEKILKDTPGFEHLAIWAGEHHEKMNGSGYPNAKKGFEISVGGRILALADNYTALSQPRPYRANPFEPLDALPLIGQGRFRLYDSPLVTILRRAVLDSEYVVQ